MRGGLTNFFYAELLAVQSSTLKIWDLAYKDKSVFKVDNACVLRHSTELCAPFEFPTIMICV